MNEFICNCNRLIRFTKSELQNSFQVLLLYNFFYIIFIFFIKSNEVKHSCITMFAMLHIDIQENI